MFDRLAPLLKIVCLALAALIVVQFTRAAARKNPLDQLSIPTALSAAGASNVLSGAKGTNSAATNLAGKNPGLSNATGTNAIGTNLVVTNLVYTKSVATNSAGMNAAGTNAPGTNAVARPASAKKETNAAPANRPSGPPGRPMSLGARPGLGGPAPDLPQPIKERVEKITQSEILGAVMRPMPMALLGIAGNHAVLRAPSGQTGLLREGEELGGVKLLRLGTNRILIEHEGQQKELTIFSGFGSETLLLKGKENPK